MTRYSIQRDDGLSDDIAGRLYSSYDEAHALLERYYADLCCSDDRVYYRIVEVSDLPSGELCRAGSCQCSNPSSH